MIKNILGCDFKYENDKMYRLDKRTNKWTCCNDLKHDTSGYIRIDIKKKQYLLHRIIFKYHNDDFDIADIPRNNPIDHKNINKLDNRIENLRAVSNSQNNRNKNKKPNCSSKYKGVSWNNENNKWRVGIRINNKTKHLGYFDIEEEAADVYNKAYDELMKL